jgi:L-seryl-tRNA(Ser) seleniumtransferase
VLWFAGDFWGDEALPLGPTVEIAHAHGVPVIADAADQIPPVANLWRFTREQGVDLAIFSGGKGLRGPQASGLIVGRADLVRGCRAHLGPFHSIGRPAKVGKEELVGLLAAVEWSLAQDETATLAAYRTVVDAWARGLDGLPGIGLERLERSHCDQPIPRLALHFDGGEERRDAVTAALWERKPRIAVLPHVEDAIAINPQLLQPGDEHTVLRALREVVAGEV